MQARTARPARSRFARVRSNCTQVPGSRLPAAPRNTPAPEVHPRLRGLELARVNSLSSRAAFRAGTLRRGGAARAISAADPLLETVLHAVSISHSVVGAAHPEAKLLSRKRVARPTHADILRLRPARVLQPIRRHCQCGLAPGRGGRAPSNPSTTHLFVRHGRAEALPLRSDPADGRQPSHNRRFCCAMRTVSVADTGTGQLEGRPSRPRWGGFQRCPPLIPLRPPPNSRGAICTCALRDPSRRCATSRLRRPSPVGLWGGPEGTQFDARDLQNRSGISPGSVRVHMQPPPCGRKSRRWRRYFGRTPISLLPS